MLSSSRNSSSILQSSAEATVTPKRLLLGGLGCVHKSGYGMIKPEYKGGLIMATFPCPFCDTAIPVGSGCHSIYRLPRPDHAARPGEKRDENQIQFDLYNCPNCGKITFQASREAGDGPVKMSVFPRAIFKHFPDYVPKSVRQDYEEACAIRTLSPKSSATLCRRCLQGMIRDFWQIHGASLNAEIKELRGKVPASQWAAIDAVR